MAPVFSVVTITLWVFYNVAGKYRTQLCWNLACIFFFVLYLQIKKGVDLAMLTFFFNFFLEIRFQQSNMNHWDAEVLWISWAIHNLIDLSEDQGNIFHVHCFYIPSSKFSSFILCFVQLEIIFCFKSKTFVRCYYVLR